MAKLNLPEIRQELHRFPEVSGQEFETAKRISAYLKSLKPDRLLEGLGGTGVLASFDSGKPGPQLLFRSELDALPIQEINDFEYKSSIDGVSHKCGHDGHMAVLLGLAEFLSGSRPPLGCISVLFQPAEEDGTGANAVLKDERFQDIHLDEVYAFHNLPGYPMGRIVVREGTISAAVRGMIIKFYGKTAHAAEPENGINPSTTIAKLILALDQISNNDQNRKDFKVITPVCIELGEKSYGVAAGAGALHITLRAWTEEVMEAMIAEIGQEVENLVEGTGLSYEFGWTDNFLANNNAKAAVAKIEKAAEINEYEIFHTKHPMKWGEDFGYFTQKFSGALFGIGAGIDRPALHNPDYDFPDELIEIGVNMFKEITNQF